VILSKSIAVVLSNSSRA